MALQENRIIITRDRLLLNSKIIIHLFCVRTTKSEEQLR
ncbi:hypothetical protein [Candidatus Scalindua japonica]